jgi:hypothetical protein
MSVNYNEDPAYANAKLHDTIVRFEGFPFYVNHISEDGMVRGRKLGQEGQSCHLSSLDLSPIPLGYVNIDRSTTYLMRVPSRQWRQGIRSSNITSIGGSHASLFAGSASSFVNLVRNIYPTPNDCLDLINNQEVISQAFSRNFAISSINNKGKKGSILLYKSLVVGTVSMGDMRASFNLSPSYHYLSETLEEERNDRV